MALPPPPISPPAPTAESVLTSLSSKNHLHREKSLSHFRTALPTYPPLTTTALKSTIPTLLTPTNPWETLHGLLQASTTLVTTLPTPDRFPKTLLPFTKPLLSHPEPRIRTASSALLHAIAAKLGASVWRDVAPMLLESARRSASMDERQRLEEAARVAGRELDQRAADAKRNGLRMVHETEGWRALESSLLAIADLVDGCGKEVLQEGTGVDEMVEVVGFVDEVRGHPNRFVREAGMRVVKSVARACRDVDGGVLEMVAGRVVGVLEVGLQDNWSQVRYAACVAVREVLEGLSTEQRRVLYPRLLPRMCLNRHYVAEGVRNLSVATWRDVVGGDGRRFVEEGLGGCVEYFEGQCAADNHAVREAACLSFGEVCLRLDGEVVKPYVGRVVRALVGCLRDESWPVRDHGCRALGGVLGRFGEGVGEGEVLEEVRGLFEGHLGDNIGSVRANCAKAVVESVRGFGEGHGVFGEGWTTGVAIRLMGRLGEQKEMRFGERDRETGFGVASKVARDNDVGLHTDQMVFSCGSLAPKLRRGAGCMDHGLRRECLPWELADGGVRLWAGLVGAGFGGVREGEVVKEVVRMGETAVRLRFGQESRIRVAWLECFGRGVEMVGKERLDGVLERVVWIVEECRKMEDSTVRRAAAECARAVRAVMGVRRYGEAERVGRYSEKQLG